ncbi:MAG: chorismate synthase [Chloroflexi bacterium]|nr:chorismate synthase [Chloroflexota bacterium]
MLRMFTAGESHGPALVCILEGMPAGLLVDANAIDEQLRRRQSGYGRGARQQIETDRVRLLGGVFDGRTIGAPVAMMVPNRDYENWREREVPPWTRPRPGHADLAGALKYGIEDLRLVAERASARETAARVSAGALARQLLSAAGIAIGSYVESIGTAHMPEQADPPDRLCGRALLSDVGCPDEATAQAMRAAIDTAREAGDSLGGTIVVAAWGLMPGLGTHVQWDRRLDGRLAQALMSIQAIKGIEIGPAFANASAPGTRVHDALYSGGIRKTNRAGGMEGGMTNGEPLWIRLAMKPIPTTITPIDTIDRATGEAAATQYQRSDVCAVPAAAVVAEAMAALVLADALLERYGGDRVEIILERIAHDRKA